MSFHQYKKDLTYRAIELTALISIILLALSTRWDPGVAGDATIYITCARNLIQGHGLGLILPQGEFRLLPYFPPFFSLVLSGLGLLHLDMVAGARWLNILCFGSLVYLAGFFTYRFSRASLFSIIAALLIAVSPILIPVYSWVMSEPLSAVLGFGGLVCIIYAIHNPDKKSYLFFSALLTGLSFLTRYSALAFLLTAALAYLVLCKQPWGRKIIDTIGFGLISGLPMGIWLIIDILNTATLGSRRMLSIADMFSRLASFWTPLRDAVIIWIIPESWFYAPLYPKIINSFLVPLAIILVLILFVLVILKWMKRENQINQPFMHLVILLCGFILIYFLIVLGVYLTTYPPITIANRMLSPLFTAFIWLIPVGVILITRLWPKFKSLQQGLSVLLILFCVIYGWRSVKIVKDYYDNGLGYTSPAWTQSQTMDAVRKLPADAIIVSNETNAIQFLAGRPAYPLYATFVDKADAQFYRFGDGDLANDPYQKLFHDGQAVFVLFDTIDDQLTGLYGDKTNERISDLVKGLKETYRGSDGGIFYYPNKP